MELKGRSKIVIGGPVNRFAPTPNHCAILTATTHGPNGNPPPGTTILLNRDMLHVKRPTLSHPFGCMIAGTAKGKHAADPQAERNNSNPSCGLIITIFVMNL